MDTAAEQPVTPSPAPKPKAKVYLESRYRKLERGLPQTIFFCPECRGHRRRKLKCKCCEGFGKLTRDSVQEIIGRTLVPAFKARFGKFHGAGREDVDVLMLGKGRPFVYEVVDSKAPQQDTEALRQRIEQGAEGRLELAPFKIVEKPRVAYWKEALFDKEYLAHVRLQGVVDETTLYPLLGQILQVEQRTPARVSTRRADLVRRRTVQIKGWELLAEDLLALELRCAHGTYVKEWVSGDEGRTANAFADLIGLPCHCEQLDVLEILVD